eukprot:GHVU01122698.1.p1 GENE.GHVU01122698.1~~GHVU01122698.1.p1  ORF type:complete len:135 (-),score=18.05 GHVU01122698.1:265-669(-)
MINTESRQADGRGVEEGGRERGKDGREGGGCLRAPRRRNRGAAEHVSNATIHCAVTHTHTHTHTHAHTHTHIHTRTHTHTSKIERGSRVHMYIHSYTSCIYIILLHHQNGRQAGRQHQGEEFGLPNTTQGDMNE